mgnify:FL=1
MALIPLTPNPTRNRMIHRYLITTPTILAIYSHPRCTAIISTQSGPGISSRRTATADWSMSPMRILLSITSILPSLLLLSASARIESHRS